MTTFHVLTVDKIKDGQGVRGPFTTWKLGLRNGDGNEPVVAELFCPANAQPPVVGATVDGEIEKTDNPSWLDKFKPTRTGGGGFGPRPEDPKRSAHIARMHAQEMGLRLFEIQVARGLIEDSVNARDILPAMIDWFTADAQKARDAA